MNDLHFWTSLSILLKFCFSSLVISQVSVSKMKTVNAVLSCSICKVSMIELFILSFLFLFAGQDDVDDDDKWIETNSK